MVVLVGLMEVRPAVVVGFEIAALVPVMGDPVPPPRLPAGPVICSGVALVVVVVVSVLVEDSCFLGERSVICLVTESAALIGVVAAIVSAAP